MTVQKLTIRCLTVSHMKLTFIFCWGSCAREEAVLRGKGAAEIQLGQWIYYRAVSKTSVKTEHPKNVPFLLGLIYQGGDKKLPCQARYDIQHQAGPLSWCQNIRTKSFENKAQSNFCSELLTVSPGLKAFLY